MEYFKMECPRCGSNSVAVSHRRGMEKYLQGIFPYKPYRCKECWVRFWKFSNPFKTLLSKVIAAVVFILIIAVIVVPLVMMKFKATSDKGQKVSRVLKPLGEIQVQKSSSTERNRDQLKKTSPVQPTLPKSYEKGAATAVTEKKEPMTTAAAGKKNVSVTAIEPKKGTESTEALKDLPTEVVSSVKTTADKKTDAATSKQPTPEKKAAADVPSKAATETLKTRDPELTKIKLALKTSKDGAAHHSLKSMKVVEQPPGTVQLIVEGTGPVSDPTWFFLKSPLRFVFDLKGDWKKGNVALETDVSVGWIDKVRLGEHADKIRFVVDLKDKIKNPQIIVDKNKLFITLTR